MSGKSFFGRGFRRKTNIVPRWRQKIITDQAELERFVLRDPPPRTPWPRRKLNRISYRCVLFDCSWEYIGSWLTEAEDQILAVYKCRRPKCRARYLTGAFRLKGHVFKAFGQGFTNETETAHLEKEIK